MDPLLTRILRTIFLCPLAAALYFSLFIALERSVRDDYALLWAAIGTYFVVCTWLILLWRSEIRWTSTRRYLTALTVPAAALLGVLVAVSGEWLDYFRELSWFIGSLVTLTSWPIMVVLVWKESVQERGKPTAPVSCPDCGYDLRGLSECRCPECGRRYTLDALYAAQTRPPLAQRE